MKHRELFFLFLGFILGGIAGFAIGFWPSDDAAIDMSYTSREDQTSMPGKNLPPNHPAIDNPHRSLSRHHSQNTENMHQKDMEKVLEKALKRLQKELVKKPKNYDLLVQAAHIYFDMERFQEAIEYYKKALEIKGDDPDLITTYGTALQRLDKLDEALVQFQRAQAIDPAHWESRYNIIIVKILKKKDVKEVRADYLKLMELLPGDVTIPSGIANAYSIEKNNTEALYYLEKALEIAPDKAMILYYIAQVYEKDDQADKAADALKRALEIAPDRVEILLYASQNYVAKKQADKAIAILQRALQTAPTNWQILAYMAYVYENNSQLAEALKTYEQILKIHPQGHASPKIRMKIAQLKQDIANKGK